MKTTLTIILILFPCLLIAQCKKLPIVYNLLKVPSSWADSNRYFFYPEVQYIGYPKDSVYVGISSNVNNALKAHVITKDFISKNRYLSHYSEAKISIQVCPDNIVKMVFKKYDFDNKISKPDILNCYPIIIKNIDSFAIDISIRRIRPIALEMEVASGVWKTIVDEYSYDCITGDEHYYIKPMEIVILTLPITPIAGKNYRFRIGKTYSNVFSKNL